jgi:hypothetical protein
MACSNRLAQTDGYATHGSNRLAQTDGYPTLPRTLHRRNLSGPTQADQLVRSNSSAYQIWARICRAYQRARSRASSWSPSGPPAIGQRVLRLTTLGPSKMISTDKISHVAGRTSKTGLRSKFYQWYALNKQNQTI